MFATTETLTRRQNQLAAPVIHCGRVAHRHQRLVKKIMKLMHANLVLFCLVASLAGSAHAQADGPARPAPPVPAQPGGSLIEGDSSRTYTSLDAPTDARSAFPPGLLKFTDSDLEQVLEIYQELSNRTLVRQGSLPNVKITVKSQTQLTRREAQQTLDTVLAANGIAMIPMGTQHIKAVPMAQAAQEAGPLIELPPDQLPESGTYITYLIKLKSFGPREAAQVLQPFCKMPGNSILAIEDSGVLVVRDYSVNVRRMIQVLNKLEAARENAGEKKP
jgi:hypothetical protein